MGTGRKILEDTSVIMHLVVYDGMGMKGKVSAEVVSKGKRSRQCRNIRDKSKPSRERRGMGTEK